MNSIKKELAEFIDNKLIRLNSERYKNTGNFYNDGLQCEEIRCNDALGSFETGFELGDLRGQYDSYMTMKLMIEKM